MAVPAGMFGVVRTNDFVGRGIRLFTKSRVNHAFVALGDGTIVEAEAKGAVISPDDRYTNALWASSLYAKLPEGRGEKIAEQARKMVGTPYNYGDIVSLALADTGIRWSWLMHHVQDPSRLICSELVDRAYFLAGVHLFSDDRPQSMVDPGDLEALIAQGDSVQLRIDG